MTDNNAGRKELERIRNRMLDFNPEIQTVSAATDTGVKGVDNAHVMLSAGINNFVVRIKGVPYKVALTSAF
jgi:hypothetical protein